MKRINGYLPSPVYGLLRRAYINFYHLRIRPVDTMVASYPKSGSTWLRFMLGELVSKKEMDYLSINDFMPSITSKSLVDALKLPGGGRLLKTHEPYTVLYKKAIYLVRDVRAVLSSYFHHKKLIYPGYDLSIEQFAEEFVGGRADGYGVWDAHVRSWQAAKQANKDILFIKYEDLRAEPERVFGRITLFLGYDLSQEAVGKIVSHNSINIMREKNKQAVVQPGLASTMDNVLVRKGETDGWKRELPVLLQRRITDIYCDLLADLGYEV